MPEVARAATSDAAPVLTRWQRWWWWWRRPRRWQRRRPRRWWWWWRRRRRVVAHPTVFAIRAVLAQGQLRSGTAIVAGAVGRIGRAPRAFTHWLVQKPGSAGGGGWRRGRTWQWWRRRWRCWRRIVPGPVATAAEEVASAQWAAEEARAAAGAAATAAAAAAVSTAAADAAGAAAAAGGGEGAPRGSHSQTDRPGGHRSGGALEAVEAARACVARDGARLILIRPSLALGAAACCLFGWYVPGPVATAARGAFGAGGALLTRAEPHHARVGARRAQQRHGRARLAVGAQCARRACGAPALGHERSRDALGASGLLSSGCMVPGLHGVCSESPSGTMSQGHDAVACARHHREGDVCGQRGTEGPSTRLRRSTRPKGKGSTAPCRSVRGFARLTLAVSASKHVGMLPSRAQDAAEAASRFWGRQVRADIAKAAAGWPGSEAAGAGRRGKQPRRRRYSTETPPPCGGSLRQSPVYPP